MSFANWIKTGSSSTEVLRTGKEAQREREPDGWGVMLKTGEGVVVRIGF